MRPSLPVVEDATVAMQSRSCQVCMRQEKCSQSWPYCQRYHGDNPLTVTLRSGPHPALGQLLDAASPHHQGRTIPNRGRWCSTAHGHGPTASAHSCWRAPKLTVTPPEPRGHGTSHIVGATPAPAWFRAIPCDGVRATLGGHPHHALARARGLEGMHTMFVYDVPLVHQSYLLNTRP